MKIDNKQPQDLYIINQKKVVNDQEDFVVGERKTIDENIDDKFVYYLVTGEGSNDNDKFIILNQNKLKLIYPADYAT